MREPPEAAAEVDDVLRQVDLNLLVSLDALLATRSVTRAAQRMGVTQSAMSHTLRKLRELLGDPLFVRAGGEMLPTPRAEALGEPVRGALVALGRILTASTGFEPAHAVRRFRLAAPDLFVARFVPRLLALLQTTAPGVDVSCEALRPGVASRLRTGDLDLAVIPRGPTTEGPSAPDLVQRTLFRDGYRLFLRADHPARETPASAAWYAALRHVLVSPDGRGQGVVDLALAEEGLTRRIALRIPTFVAGPAVVAASDLVLTAPTSLAALVGPDVAVLEPPLPLPEHAITLVWHPRFGADAGHTWFREQLATRCGPYPGAAEGHGSRTSRT